MAIAAGLPMPRVYTIDDTAPNAFATGRDPQHAVIAVTPGLRSKLNREELQGVIGHEMSHIRNFDIRFAVLMSTLVGSIMDSPRPSRTASRDSSACRPDRKLKTENRKLKPEAESRVPSSVLSHFRTFSPSHWSPLRETVQRAVLEWT